MSTPRVAYHSFAPQAFPLTIEWWAEADGRLRRAERVDGPGALYLPPMSEPVTVRMVFADGYECIVTSGGAWVEPKPGDR